MVMATSQNGRSRIALFPDGAIMRFASGCQIENQGAHLFRVGNADAGSFHDSIAIEYQRRDSRRRIEVFRPSISPLTPNVQWPLWRSRKLIAKPKPLVSIQKSPFSKHCRLAVRHAISIEQIPYRRAFDQKSASASGDADASVVVDESVPRNFQQQARAFGPGQHLSCQS